MNKKNFAVIIFARYNSSRFLGKVLRHVKGKSILEHLYERFNKKKLFKNIIIATSKNKSDKKIINFCIKKKIKYYVGSHLNVAKRAIDCCKKFKLTDFMRICSDRLFFDINIAVKIYKFYKKSNYEIYTNNLIKSFPFGQTCEIINYNTLIKFYKEFNKSDKEHILNFFYRNKNNFRIKNFLSKIPDQYKSVKLTIDTETDYLRAIKCFEDLKINYKLSNKKILKYYYQKYYKC